MIEITRFICVFIILIAFLMSALKLFKVILVLNRARMCDPLNVRFVGIHCLNCLLQKKKKKKLLASEADVEVIIYSVQYII